MNEIFEKVLMSALKSINGLFWKVWMGVLNGMDDATISKGWKNPLILLTGRS